MVQKSFFILRNVSFHTAKGAFSYSERTPFSMRKATFEHVKGYLLQCR